MIKQAMTMVAWAALTAAPALVGAQATTTPPPVNTEPVTCDCPVGDARGSLRDLAAFAPLGLLGALAAAGGGLPVIGGNTPLPPTNLASNDPPPSLRPDSSGGSNTDITPEPPADVPRGDIPVPVTADSLRGGIRAPNTGTPLPSVFLIGSGLIAVGCVAIFRTRG